MRLRACKVLYIQRLRRRVVPTYLDTYMHITTCMCVCPPSTLHAYPSDSVSIPALFSLFPIIDVWESHGWIE